MTTPTHRHGAFRAPHALFPLLLSIAALSRADVTGVTGSISSSESISHYGFSQSISIAIQGTNFALNAFISSDNLVKTSANYQTVTFYPAGSTSDLTPMVIAANPGYNQGTLVYNGATYYNLQINLNPIGSPATVANSGTPSNYYFYNGSAASVPFSLTGTVTAYAAPPNPQGVQSSAPLLTVNFSGGGIYSGGVHGSFPSSGSPGSTGAVSYAFSAIPLGFSTDSTTGGSWTGNYGGEGYLIPNGPVYNPGYAAVSTLFAMPYTWAAQTTDVRALQNGPGNPVRLASAYTGNSFNINLNFTDRNPHRVALYLLDFDTSGRSETLTVTNADTGVVLDTETISNFQNGIYAIWYLQGNITINVKRSSGGGAVVGGIFFGPPATVIGNGGPFPPSKVTFLGTDPATKGAWQNAYGSAGYMIANGPSSTPAQATMSVGGAATYTWAGRTTDARALAINSKGGIASAYTQYPSTSFKINLNTNSGATGKLSLYLLDWDNEGRTETITITDLSTGVVLDTETVSQFQGGIYVSWQVSGNVVVQITPSASTSAVVSGVFLN